MRRYSESESTPLISKKSQQTIQLQRQLVTLKAIYIGLKAITDPDTETAIYPPSDGDRKEQSSDDRLMLLLRKITARENPVLPPESMEVDAFICLANICFQLSHLHIDFNRASNVEEILDKMSQVFSDSIASVDDEDEQKQLPETTSDYYSIFKFCMKFMTSYFLKTYQMMLCFK